MARISKKRKEVLKKIEINKKYTLSDASKLVKEISYTKFDSSVDIDVRLGVDPKKANQMVRGVVSLPHGTGKDVRVLALVPPDKEAEAREAGADHVGLDDYIQKIEQGWVDIDIIVTMPSVMAKLGKLGRILGPRNLMPNPKSGTVTMEIGKAVKEVKAGKIDFKVDKEGAIHASIGKSSMEPQKLFENAVELISAINKLKPSAAKGTYLKGVSLSSTMSPGLSVDTKSIPGI
jgi:large subunit ribosomal protein L1